MKLDFSSCKKCKNSFVLNCRSCANPGACEEPARLASNIEQVAGFVGPTGAGGGPTIMARAALRLIVIVFELLADDQEPVGRISANGKAYQRAPQTREMAFYAMRNVHDSPALFDRGTSCQSGTGSPLHHAYSIGLPLARAGTSHAGYGAFGSAIGQKISSSTARSSHSSGWSRSVIQRICAESGSVQASYPATIKLNLGLETRAPNG
jgi:hypothetical protein